MLVFSAAAAARPKSKRKRAVAPDDIALSSSLTDDLIREIAEELCFDALREARGAVPRRSAALRRKGEGPSYRKSGQHDEWC